MIDEKKIIRVDAKTFQDALGELAATMVQKVFREGAQHIAGPSYIGEDVAVMLRYGASVYNLLNYLNADERRKEDCYWHVRYGVTAMSLVRALIDCLYNVTAILENPVEKGPAYPNCQYRLKISHSAGRKMYHPPEKMVYSFSRLTEDGTGW